MKKHNLLLFLFLTFSCLSFSQTTLYSENFSGETGKGVVGPTPYTYDTVGMTWAIDVALCDLADASDHFKVNVSDQFEASDVDDDAIWYSPSIDISSVTFVNLSVDVAETGSMASTEFVQVYYILDGGSETLFETNGDNSDEFTSATATHNYLSGSTVQIVIKADNNAGTRTHTFDNITVIEALTNAPTAGDVLITEYARHLTTTNRGYLELYNTTSTDIHLTGSKLIVSGSNNEVLDFDSDIPGTNIVPANGFLILNRDASQSNFETTWGVTLGTGSWTVNYNRTVQNAFGNNNLFVLKTGGTDGIDDGTLIDESTENASAAGKRVFQLPEGNWSGNIDDASERATPGSFYNYEDITLIQLAYTGGSWAQQTGYAFSSPSASTGAAAAVVVNGNATFSTGSQLNILGIWPDAGTDITTETVTITTGLYIAHDASITITSTGSITCAGEISVSKEGHNTAADYTIWGSPFSTSLRVDSVFTDHNDCDFYVLKASTQEWKHDYTVGETIDCYGNSHTITSANIITSPEGSPDGSFDVGRGYFIVGHTSNEYDFKITSGATLNNGNVEVNIYGSSSTTTDGSNDWNLLSNPYPSAVSINSFLSTNSGTITNAVYLYTPGTGISTSSYESFNSTDTKYMASCQGFFVDASTITDGLIGTVSFTNSMRSNENNNFRSLSPLTGIYLSISNSPEMKDITRLYFDENCKSGIDSKYDAVKMENTQFTFSSIVEDKKLVFNGLPELTTETSVIPLHFATNEAAAFTISIDSLLGDLTNKQVLLEDRYNRKFHDLKHQDYTFTSAAKEWKNRFFIHVIHQKDNDNSGSGPINGIADVSTADIKVFTTENEIIVSSENKKISSVNVLTITGNSIITSPVNDFTFRVNTNKFSQGIYLVKLTLSNGETATRKVMIQ